MVPEGAVRAPERGDAEVSRSARPGAAIQQHEIIAGVESELAEEVPYRQARLARADDHHGGVGRPVGHLHKATVVIRPPRRENGDRGHEA